MRRYLLIISCFLLSLPGIAQNNQGEFCFEKCSHAAAGGLSQRIEYYQYPSMNKYDVKYLKLDLNMEANSRALTGTALTRVRALQTIDTFIIELRNNMIVDSVFINGVKKTFLRGSDHVFIPLAPALPAGTMIDALFYYRGTVNGGIYVGQSGSFVYTATLSESFQAREWFPAKQILPDKIDSSEIWVTTSATNKVGSNGLLMAVVDMPNSKKQYRWKTRYKENYYMPSVAIANYMEYLNYAKPVAMAPDSIPVLHYVDANSFSANKTNLDRTPPFIEKQSELFSLYPFKTEKYGHAQANIGGGMEHQTMSTMASFSTGIVAHELAHMWFGDNVTCATWNHIWLNEGFASYAEYLMMENFPSFYGSSAASQMLNVHNNVMSSPNGSVFVPDASVYDENRIFSGRLSYNKGSAIIHTLRFEIQNDNLFFQTLKNYQQLFKDSVATANDFKLVAEITTGKNFTDFFNQWYYGEGYPTFNVDYSKQGNEIVLFVNQVASAPTITPFFKGLYEMTINTTQGDTTVKINQTVNNQFFRFPSNRTPTGVIVDPNNWVLNKANPVTTGLNDPQNVSNQVILYPNPSKADIVLKYPINWFDDLSIFDEAGRKIFAQRVQRGSAQQVIKTKLLPGVYILRMDGKEKIAVKKIIVSN